MIKDYDTSYKIIIAGRSGVGKSALLLRFVDNYFSLNISPTIGVDFKFRSLNIDDKKIKLQIWDTAGSENFKSIVPSYYRNCDAVILVFTRSDKLSFQEVVQYSIEQVNKYKQPNCQLMLIANKIDIIESQVSNQSIQLFMKQHKIKFYHQTSAKTGEEVTQAFLKLTKQLLIKRPIENISQLNSNNIQLFQQQTTQKEPTKKCCK